jgi:hypothetical protein
MGWLVLLCASAAFAGENLNNEADRFLLQKMPSLWAQAWSNKDFVAYSRFYSSSLANSPLIRNRKLNSQGDISVKVSDIKIVAISDTDAQLTMNQEYHSERIQDKGRKTLNLKKSNGVWKIAAEKFETEPASQAKPSAQIASVERSQIMVPAPIREATSKADAPVAVARQTRAASPRPAAASNTAAVQTFAADRPVLLAEGGLKIQSVAAMDEASAMEFVRVWANAWRRGDLPAYQALYAPRFINTAWSLERRSEFQRHAFLGIRPSLVRVTVPGAEQVVVQFHLLLAEDKKQDSAFIRTFVLNKEAGRWLISAEYSSPAGQVVDVE